MSGHTITIGDISIFFEVALFITLLSYDLKTNFPKLNQWVERVAQHEIVAAEWNDYHAWIAENLLPKITVPKEDTFDLYFSPISQPSAALKTLLDISGVKYTPHIIDMAKGEHKQPEYLKIHPMG